MSILLSVIIPVYNTSAFLKECIESVLRQNIQEMEIILVDDGSTDESPFLCKQFALSDPRIRVIHQKNFGLSSARNRALNVCKGKYITFVDSDDVLLDNTYSPNLEILETDERITAVQFPYIYPYNQPNQQQGADSKEIWKGERDILEAIMSHKINHAVWNKIYHRSIFAELRFPEGQIFEDSYIVPDLAKSIQYLCSSGTGAYGYNLNSCSTMTSENSPKKMQDRFLAYERIITAASFYPDLSKSLSFLKYYHYCLLLATGISKSKNTIPDCCKASIQRFQNISYCLSSLFKIKDLSFKEKNRLLLVKIIGLQRYLSHLS